MLLNYQKKCPYECYYICVPKHSSDKDLLLLMSSAMGYYPYGDSSSLQMEIATHINNGGHPVVFLIDEIDNLCPKTARGGVTNLDKLDVVRVIWDYENSDQTRYCKFLQQISRRASRYRITCSCWQV